MAIVANEILTMTLGLLNDPNKAIYKDVKMLPILDKIYRELQTKLSSMGIKVTQESSTLTTVTAGTTILIDGSGLPNDILKPNRLLERIAGSSDRFAPMNELPWDPDITIGTALVYWVWEEEELHFPGALGDRQLLIHYTKTLGKITSSNSPILIKDAEVWLSQRLASTAALLIGNNPTRAKALNDDLVSIWSDLKSTKIKQLQGIPVRRRRTRYRVN